MDTLPALARIDSYKLGHIAQYPPNTERVYSNLTPRSHKWLMPLVPERFRDDVIVAFGMEMVVRTIHNVFEETFFTRDIDEVIEEFGALIQPFVGPSEFDFYRIRALHELGYLPISVKSLPEGTLVTPGIPVLTIVNTLDAFAWITNFLETWLSADSWKVMVSATIARFYRKILEHYTFYTGSSAEFIDWQAHDFSSRGMSGIQDAATTGLGHLLFFTGSDNISATWTMQKHYVDDVFVAGSVPATEHSVMCMGGEDNEIETFRRLIEDVYPSGVVSIVSDTWDFWEVVTSFAAELKDKILARSADPVTGLAKVVLRPDSGDPVDIICGTARPPSETHDAKIGDVFFFTDTYYRVVDIINENELIIELIKPTPEMMGAVECLWKVFGGTETNTGHRLLDSHIGLIYGDSITLERANKILSLLAAKNFASGNIVLGVGSYTYQHVTRDTIGMAMKATWGKVDGESRELFKEPKTDPNKKSARGLLSVTLGVDGETLELKNKVTEVQEQESLLGPLYKDGDFLRFKEKLSVIRERAQRGL